MGDWKAMALIVRAVLDGKKVDDLDREGVTTAVAHGLIESCEQQKPCPTCGTPKFDYRFWRVTAAGRLLADAHKGATQ